MRARAVWAIGIAGASAAAACSLITPVDDLLARDAGGDGAIADAGAPDTAEAAATDSGTPDTGTPCGRPGLDKGLVAYWPMDEGSGSFVRDCTQNHYDGKFVRQDPDGGSWTPGAFGSAITVSAPNGCVDFGTPQGLRFPGAFTASAWVYVAANPVDTSYVVGQTLAANISGWRVALLPGPQTDWQMGIEDAGNAELLANGPGTGKWRHIAGVFKPGAAIEVYVAGTPGGALTSGVPPKVWEDLATMRVGCRGDDTLYFPGAIDEVRLYDRALTPVEIAGLAQ